MDGKELVVTAAQWSGFIAAGLGWAGQQFLKADSRVDNRLAVIILAVIGFVGFALGHPWPTTDTLQPWLQSMLMWTFGPAGLGSALQHFGLASKTQEVAK